MIIRVLLKIRRTLARVSFLSIVAPLALFSVSSLSAQNFLNSSANSHLGVGITVPQGTLHVHETIANTPFGDDLPGDPTMGIVGTESTNDVDFPNHYSGSIRLTNPNSGTTTGRGFAILQDDWKLTMQQYENAPLHILGYNGTGITILANGNVGIGTQLPTQKLHVLGDSRISGTLLVGSTLTTMSSMMVYADANIAGGLTVGGDTYLGSGFECMEDGRVRCKEVEVTLDGWPDFVFEDSYNIMSISELEHFVNQNKHLPNVPSASNVERNGVRVGEMNAILLQKIEELTLYIIQLQNQINELKSPVSE